MPLHLSLGIDFETVSKRSDGGRYIEIEIEKEEEIFFSFSLSSFLVVSCLESEKTKVPNRKRLEMRFGGSRREADKESFGGCFVRKDN